MCIHDMRNPTTAIKLGLQQVLNNLNDIKNINEDHEAFDTKLEDLSKKLKDSINSQNV